jgi:hypothetical protein
MGEGGVLLETSLGLKVGSLLDIRIQHRTNESLKVWMSFKGKVVWVDKNLTRPNYYRMGVVFQTAMLRKKAPRHKEKDAPIRCAIPYAHKTG